MFTEEQKKVLCRQAAELTGQQADHSNDREALAARHQKEREEAGIQVPAGVPLSNRPAPAPTK